MHMCVFMHVNICTKIYHKLKTRHAMKKGGGMVTVKAGVQLLQDTLFLPAKTTLRAEPGAAVEVRPTNWIKIVTIST